MDNNITINNQNFSYIDKITGLHNNRYYQDQILRNSIIKDIYPLTIVKIDINGLDNIKQKYDNETGIRIIKRIGKIIKLKTNYLDIAMRLQAGSFLVISLGDKIDIVNRLISKYKKDPIKINASNEKVTISYGISIMGESDDNINKKIEEADLYMQYQKATNFDCKNSKVLRTILKVLNSTSQETTEHAERMRIRAAQLGRSIDLSPLELMQLEQLALLHDIGKVSVSPEILNKNGKLNEKEWEEIKKHPGKGHDIAMRFEEFKSIAKFILHHHERWDGRGYPDNLEGNEIPLLSRIINVIDSYDAMTNERAYKKAYSKEEAIAELKDCSGAQFDPVLAKKFIEILDQEGK